MMIDNKIDLKGLPKEVLENLNLKKCGALNQKIKFKGIGKKNERILNLLSECPMNLDLLVYWHYKKYRIVVKKHNISAALYLLKKEGYVESQKMFWNLSEKGVRAIGVKMPADTVTEADPRIQEYNKISKRKQEQQKLMSKNLEELRGQGKLKEWDDLLRKSEKMDLAPQNCTKEETDTVTKEFTKKSWLPNFLRPQNDR